MKCLIDRGLILIEITNKLLEAAFVVKIVRFTRALILEIDIDAGVEKRQLAQAFGQLVKVKLDIAERVCRWPEMNQSTGLLRCTDLCERCLGHTVAIFLFEYLAFAPDSQGQGLCKRVDHRYTNAVE